VGRFASTAPFYEEAREPYGAVFFERVAGNLGLGGRERLLDLGAGPGLLAIGFARYVGEVVGVDPEPAMIEAARRGAERTGTAVRLIESRAEALPSDIGTFDIVTIGRALHWIASSDLADAFSFAAPPASPALTILGSAPMMRREGAGPKQRAQTAMSGSRTSSLPGRASGAPKL